MCVNKEVIKLYISFIVIGPVSSMNTPSLSQSFFLLSPLIFFCIVCFHTFALLTAVFCFNVPHYVLTTCVLSMMDLSRT